MILGIKFISGKREQDSPYSLDFKLSPWNEY